MCPTAHYIDSDRILRKKIINFKLVPYPHTSLVILNAIERCIFYWNLKDKLCAITMDNCTTNHLVVKKLKDNISERFFLERITFT
ncbi:hypothetical protein AMTRI_Chr02g258780 [Amborella trichopoda]